MALNVAFFVNAAILIVSAAAFLRQGDRGDGTPAGSQPPLTYARDKSCRGPVRNRSHLQWPSLYHHRNSGRPDCYGRLPTFQNPPILAEISDSASSGCADRFDGSVHGCRGELQIVDLEPGYLEFAALFAMIPLIHFTNDKRIMGEFVSNSWAKVLAWAVALGILGLNIKLVADQIGEWIQSSPAPAWIWATIVPMLCALGVFLLYIFLRPFIHLPEKERLPGWRRLSHFIRAEEDKLDLDVYRYKRIGVAVAHNNIDKQVLSHALPLARQHDAMLYLFHVVEGAAGVVFGADAFDAETRHDEDYLRQTRSRAQPPGSRSGDFLGVWTGGQGTDPHDSGTENRSVGHGRPRT